MSAFARIGLKAWQENILLTALVELTYRCNLDCFFCYNDTKLRGEPMTKDEYLRFFADLKDMNVLTLTLTGGEPLAHPDFMTLGRAARELGFLVRVKSNGHALSGKLAQRLKEEVDPFYVEVSLHGARAATHDRQTRVDGSFDRLMKNLREMLALGLRVKINSTLTAYNEGELPEIYALADDLGVEMQVETVVTPRDDGSQEPLVIAASRQGVLEHLRIEARRRPAPSEPTSPARWEPTPGKNCGTGAATVAVDPFGNVYPCVQWRRPVGNLHRQSIKEIWKTSTDLAEVRRLSVAAKEVVDGHGPDGMQLGFCPGIAWAQTGNPLAVYPEAAQRFELHGEVERERLPATGHDRPGPG